MEKVYMTAYDANSMPNENITADVAIIGGGINGCGCAADAAQRGLSVVLFEQDDFGRTQFQVHGCSRKW